MARIATNNKINVTGGTQNIGLLNGGFGVDEASGNEVNISTGTIGDVKGGQINENVWAGRIYNPSDSPVANNNIVNISGNPDLSETSLFGYVGDASNHSGNTLNIYSKNLTAQNIYNFDKMNFYLDSNILNGDTMMTLTDEGENDLSNTDITAIMQGG